jgi:nucleolin
MGSKKEKKEKKDKKEKKEKKRKRQKVDEDNAINDNDGVAMEEHGVSGLPPDFYKTNAVEKEVSEEPTSTTDDADATNDTPATTAEGEGATTATGKKKRKRKRKRKTETNNDDDNDAANDDADDGNGAGSTFDVSAMVLDTIFVEGIPFDASPDNVRAFFVEDHGIDSRDVLELRLPTWQDTGRLRGFGHVRFASTESYEKALGLDRKYMGRRYLSIQPAKSSSGNHSGKSIEDPSNMSCPEGGVTIYVNNLPYDATEEIIEAAFLKHTPKSTIAEDGVRIARNSVNRQSKGFCYIDFVTTKDAQRLMKAAVKKNVLVGGRIVRLDYDTGRAKGSFRTESGQLLNKNHEE